MRILDEMKPIKVDIRKLFTQAAYAKHVGLTRARINQKVRAKEVKTVQINGAILIIED